MSTKTKHAHDILTTLAVDGDLDAVVVRIPDTGTRESRCKDRYRHTISHGLGRVPVGCQIIMQDAPCQVAVLSKNEQKIVIQFTEERVDVNVRIW